MVPSTASAKTAIQAPVSRGAEPCVAATDTITPGAAARARASCSVLLFDGIMAASLIPPHSTAKLV